MNLDHKKEAKKLAMQESPPKVLEIKNVSKNMGIILN